MNGATYYKINDKYFGEIGLYEKMHGFRKAIEEQQKNGGEIEMICYFNNKCVYKGGLLPWSKKM